MKSPGKFPHLRMGSHTSFEGQSIGGETGRELLDARRKAEQTRNLAVAVEIRDNARPEVDSEPAGQAIPVLDGRTLQCLFALDTVNRYPCSHPPGSSLSTSIPGRSVAGAPTTEVQW
jgi:hypothetical protein